MTHPQLIAAMSRPEFYPGNPDRIDLLQTHISLIFIAGELVYKVKKAVDFGFLDFTTLEKRQFYCQEELRAESEAGAGGLPGGCGNRGKAGRQPGSGAAWGRWWIMPS